MRGTDQKAMYVRVEDNSVWEEVMQDEDTYIEFIQRFVEHVTSKTGMNYMAAERGGKQYNEVVTVSDECFAIMAFEDKMRLWMEVVKRRSQRDKEPGETDAEFRERRLVREIQVQGATKREKDIEDELKDENGCMYTLYSNGGRKEPHVLRGYNVGAIKRMNELQGFIMGRRTREDVKTMLKQIGKRWIKVLEEERKGGRKRKLRYLDGRKAENGGSDNTEYNVLFI